MHARTLPKISTLLFLLALLVYLAVRLIALDQFPIYFFSDEAVQAVRAADFVRDGLRSETGEFLPTYFKNSYQYNLGPSVYIQILPTLLFGKQIVVTRAVAAIFSVLAALAAGLTFEWVFPRKSGWLAILLLSVMPAWFLHSRTAFETALAVSFYSAFWLAYALYRFRSRGYIYLAILFAALAFYSYSPAQVVVSLTLAAFFLNDLHYHWQNRKLMLKVALLSLLLLTPYLRFIWLHPGEVQYHLQIVGSVWTSDVVFLQKLTASGLEYVRALNPYYWFFTNPVDLPRHVMKGYGHLWLPALPVIAIGLGNCLANLRSSRHRLILIALLAAPAGAALAQLGITRALFMVFPATLLAVQGLLTVADWVARTRWAATFQNKRARMLLPLVVFTGLLAANTSMLVDALRNGPLWFTDYGLYGMQYGARQVFGKIKKDLAADPHIKFVLSPAWANGTDILAHYFFADPVPFELASIDSYTRDYRPLDKDTVLILPPNEHDDMLASGKFQNITTRKELRNPDGSPAFYFVQLEYVDDIAEIFAGEQAARRNLVRTDALLQDGSLAIVHYSTLDMGSITDLFDGDALTVARTWESNPFTLVFEFPKPRTVNQLLVRVGGEPTRIELELYPDMNDVPMHLGVSTQENPNPRDVTIDLNLTQPLKKAIVRVYNENEPEPAHVHLFEIRFLPDLE